MVKNPSQFCRYKLPNTPLKFNCLQYFWNRKRKMALKFTPLKPSLWLRYKEDTFILWPHQEEVQLVLDHFNSIRTLIQFTMEKENNKLAFLDVLISETEHGIKTFVYRKSTFTRQYLNYNFHHPYTV